jgi:23S rRNA pseudouridine1911/1915/1917 synthase
MIPPFIHSEGRTAKRHFFEVGEAGAGSRLDEFLAERLRGLSRMRIAVLLDKGAVKVNGQTARAGLRLAGGDRVEIEVGEPAPNSMTPEPLPLEVIHEDEHLVVVVKPAGMLMHPTRGVKTGTLANALAHWLGARGLAPGTGSAGPSATEAGGPGAGKARSAEEVNAQVAPDEGREVEDEPARDAEHPAAFSQSPFIRPGLVHRLDRATSGLVVVAKTRAALSRLSDHFKRRLVEKRYLAVLRGEVEADELEIRAPIGREEGARPQWRVTEAGRPAETRLRVLGRRGRLTLVELEPVTGRTNQLRIHCAHIGHPVAGDEWHAPDSLPRLCLHAARLAFNHPATDERMVFLSPLPEEVEAVWRDGEGG